MRIGFEITPITRARTGVGQYCYYLLMYLQKLAAPDDAFVGFSSGRETPRVPDTMTAMRQIRVPIPTRLLYRTWDTFHRPRVDRLLGGVDVFHATNFVLPPTATAPRVLTVHDITFLTVPRLCSPKIANYFARNIHRFAADADAILVHSEATRADLVEKLALPAAKIAVAPPGVDPNLRAADREHAGRALRDRYGVDTPFVLFAGTLEPRKNVAGALEAFARSGEAKRHEFILIGKRGWNCASIFTAIDALGLGGRVRHLGYLESHRDLALFYAAADAFLFPTHYEGFGLPVLEAMACGCPVVTSNSSSIPEVAGDAALMAAPDDVDAHARHLDRILGDPGFAATLRQRGRARSTSFTWDRCAGVTLQTYRKVAA